ncbi:TetR/AcrR family transcriptional regulator [Acidiferrimicrobium sp. IK]|uniref:TetR/AcrR family transcriptional regulator n=1 Tax=Acidiferrimicrobium sp. IK TaxID=2871700 RepID=UPI0021CB08BE|nr:TetR/AcrR family transcriptional regulator [Acidiferrimicrobium sp. IK]MCU4183462.1 TetR/AcrR family transcriptional regulator [Acidiferrimicrobium sp. IK]
MLEAAAELLSQEGTGAITHQRVAERSGVSRATIYRHWATAADLLYATMANIDEPFFREGDGPLLSWLRKELRRAVQDMSQPAAVQFTAFLIERAALEPPGADLRDRLLRRTTIPLERALRRAVAAGELVGLPTTDDLLAELLGPILFRVVHSGGVADDAFIDRVIDLALAPWLVRAESNG